MAICPCEVVAPCSESCGCAFPGKSTTCRRCATFGPDVERILRADLLATLVDHGEKAGLAIQRDRRGPAFLNFVCAFERFVPASVPWGQRGVALLSFLRRFRSDLAERAEVAPEVATWRDHIGALQIRDQKEFFAWLGENWAPPAEVPS